jgi:hypothetical protein
LENSEYVKSQRDDFEFGESRHKSLHGGLGALKSFIATHDVILTHYKHSVQRLLDFHGIRLSGVDDNKPVIDVWHIYRARFDRPGHAKLGRILEDAGLATERTFLQNAGNKAYRIWLVFREMM